jgi:hypothetical protein
MFNTPYIEMNAEIITQQLLFLCDCMKKEWYELSKTKVFKLFWFANLRMANKYWRLLNQDVFLNDHFWPVPVNVKSVVESIIFENDHHRHQNISVKTTREIDWYDDNWIPYTKILFEAMNDFDDDYLSEIDQEVLKVTVTKYWGKSARFLSNLTHEEWWAWDSVSLGKLVDITIDMDNDKYVDIVKETYSSFWEMYLSSLALA